MKRIDWNFVIEQVSNKEKKEITTINNVHIDTTSNYNNCDPFPQSTTVFDEIVSQTNGTQIIFTLTGFLLEEYLRLYSLIENEMAPKKQGKRPKIEPKDAFLFTLIHLKGNTSTSEIAAMYNLSKESMFRVVNKTIDICYTVFVPTFIKFFTYEQQKAFGWLSEEFPDCIGVIDTTFQPSTKPWVNFKDAKLLFSGKHWSYGLKTQGIHSMNGLCMLIDTGIPAARHDFDIFNSTLPRFAHLFQKNDTEYYNIMGDLGYVGQTVVQGMKLITPKKNRKDITTQEIANNSRISKKRIVCENFYGRLKCKFKIMRDRYTMSKGNYHIIAGLCIALTNYHVQMYPLKEEDGEFNRKQSILTTQKNRSDYVQKEKKKKRKKPNRFNPYPVRNDSFLTIGSDDEYYNQSDEEHFLTVNNNQ